MCGVRRSGQGSQVAAPGRNRVSALSGLTAVPVPDAPPNVAGPRAHQPNRRSPTWGSRRPEIFRLDDEPPEATHPEVARSPPPGAGPLTPLVRVSTVEVTG